jgi:hypothetical protein
MHLRDTPQTNTLRRSLVSQPTLTLSGRTLSHHEVSDSLLVLFKYQKIHFASLKYIFINWSTLSENALFQHPPDAMVFSGGSTISGNSDRDKAGYRFN